MRRAGVDPASFRGLAFRDGALRCLDIADDAVMFFVLGREPFHEIIYDESKFWRTASDINMFKQVVASGLGHKIWFFERRTEGQPCPIR